LTILEAFGRIVAISRKEKIGWHGLNGFSLRMIFMDENDYPTKFLITFVFNVGISPSMFPQFFLSWN